MSEAIENQELIALFSKFSGERIVYAAELKELIAQHEGTTGNERPLWICQIAKIEPKIFFSDLV